MLITFFTFVYKTGAARRSDNPQTKKTPLLRLVMVHRDLDFIGKTITINLKFEKMKQYRKQIIILLHV